MSECWQWFWQDRWGGGFPFSVHTVGFTAYTGFHANPNRTPNATPSRRLNDRHIYSIAQINHEPNCVFDCEPSTLSVLPTSFVIYPHSQSTTGNHRFHPWGNYIQTTWCCLWGIVEFIFPNVWLGRATWWLVHPTRLREDEQIRWGTLRLNSARVGVCSFS